MPSASVNPASSVPPAAQAVNVPGATNGTNPLSGMMSSPNFAQSMQNMPSMQSSMPANPMPQQNTSPQGIQQQVQLLQMLQAQGVPQEQWAPLLQVLMNAGATGTIGGATAQPGWQQNNGGFGRDDQSSRDRNGYDSYNVHSPPGRYRDRRSRSRSPAGYNRRRDATPPRRRDSPVYGDYGRGGSRRQGGGGVGGRGNEYRQRSPQDQYRRSASPHGQDQRLPPPGPKMIAYEPNLPPNHIKGKFASSSANLMRSLLTFQNSFESNSLRRWSHVSDHALKLIPIKTDHSEVPRSKFCAASSLNLV